MNSAVHRRVHRRGRRRSAAPLLTRASAGATCAPHPGEHMRILARSFPFVAAVSLVQLTGCGGGLPDDFAAAAPASRAVQADDDAGRGATTAAILKSCRKGAAGDACTVQDAT